MKKKRIAIYPGTFDPIHNGHIDIATRAAKLFDVLEFVVAINVEKEPLFTVEERLALITDSTKHINNIKVNQFTGLVVDYAKNSDSIAIIRGLRHVSDCELEFQMAMMNYHLNPELSTILMMPDEKHIHLNSNLVKEIARLHGDIVDYVPLAVHKHLKAKFN